MNGSNSMKQQVFYIHGGEGFLNHEDFLERLRTQALWHLPTSNSFVSKKWTDSLADDLGADFEVVAPAMPNKQNAKFEEWKIWFERHFEYLHDDAILIGYSLGAMFLVKYLANYDLPFVPKKVFLMAGAYEVPGFVDDSCGDFLIAPEKVATIQEKLKNIVIFHSKDDFVVPFAHGEALAKALPEAKFVVFENKNHFLIEEFPELLAEIRG